MQMISNLNRAVLMAAAVILFTGTAALSAERTETYPFSSGKKMEVNLEGGGSISISGWDKPEAEITFKAESRNAQNGTTWVETTEEGLKVFASAPKGWNRGRSLQVSIRLPREADLDLHTTGGDIQLENLDGTSNGQTMGGEISLINVSGKTALKTMGGEIDISQSKVQGKIVTMGGDINVNDSEMDGDVHTMGGDVLVQNVIGDIHATTNGGNVQYINVRKRNNGIETPGRSDSGGDIEPETVQISSMGGDVDVDDAPEGAVVNTAGGDINIRNAARFVKARSGGGDVDIRIAHGWVSAITGAGDVDVTVDKDPGGDGDITVVTGSGDVSLTVPADFSMKLDIDLAVIRSSDQDYGIYCNFDFDEKRTSDWENSGGSYRKHIIGTGTIAGGTHLVKIRTVNGDVRINQQ